MKQQQSGFTLIELVMVITILGILAASAIPKFVDLSTEAQQAATDGVAGAAGAAMAINIAVCSASASHADCNNSVAACSDAAGLLAAGSFPTGYSASGTFPTCQVDGPDSTSGDFQGIATP